MWESAKTVAPTPNSAIVQIDVDDSFVINSTHLKMICENKFDGYLRADPHDHIRKFLAICDTFKYKETQSEAVKLLIFPYFLSDKAKTWFNELNEESITSWEQMRRAFINRFFPPSLFTTEEHASKMPWARSDQRSYYSNILSGSRRTHSGNPGLLFNHDWSIKSQNDHHQRSVAFADGSKNDNSRLMEKFEALPIKIDSQFQSLKEEMHEMHKNYNNRGGNPVSKNDDTPMYERHETNYIRSEDYQN
ncbi:reverse transcriptase domain-containing protein [Tanacetum coccineum]